MIALPGRVAPVVVPAPDDFDEFYAAHVHGLLLQMYAYIGDRDEAQDLVQEAFCRAYARWSRVSTYDDPLAWVRRVAWNLARSRWRRHRVAAAFLMRQREEYTDGPNPDRVTLLGALATLSADQRRVFVLHYIADMTVAEIAEQESIALGTVKSWLHRARAILAARLADDRRNSNHA